MNIINLSGYKEPGRDIIGRQATDDDYDDVISSDTILQVNGVEVLRYQILTGRALALAKTLSEKSELTEGERTSGLKTRSAIYGYMPRNPVRCDWCRVTQNTKRHPGLHSLAVEYAEAIDDMYPDDVGAGGISEDWRMGRSRFCSLNVNVNFAIKYHTDSGNIKGMKSNVFIYRKGCSGGRLVVPGARLAFEQKMGALIIFDGHSITHGVTAIKPERADYMRSSIVLYTMHMMQHCLSPNEESMRSKQKMSAQAREKRLGNPRLRERYRDQLKNNEEIANG